MNWRLKELRTNRRLTQQNIADYLGVTHTTYNYYEKMKSEPNIETLSKLAVLFNTTIDHIVGRETSLINLSAMDNRTKKMIENILEMNDSQKLRCESYIDGIMGK